jgi:UDPglucose--hexose-1-phosphate uridylyltransferase
MICDNIYELVRYGIKSGLVDKEDEVYTINRLLEILQLNTYEVPNKELPIRPLCQILEDIIAYALSRGILEDDTITSKDLFDTKVMSVLTPMPSVVRSKFRAYYEESPKKATDYYYQLSQRSNYIREDRIKKDEKWTVDSEYGLIDITINLSKPEKDPRDIAKGKVEERTNYPSCLLCKENEGYAGHITHPARQNHRIIPIELDGEQYYFQYSPYIYYNEHCIIFNDKHIPMKIDKAVFTKLLSFVKAFPHYMAGSNSELPIVGGSILSHDHFQGGNYEFAITKAPYEIEFKMKKYPNVHAGTIKWPMSVIRLRSKDLEEIAKAADDILGLWRGYTDEEAFILSNTYGEPHNTITPIARKREGGYELDLVLRNNITTKESPWGVYHPSEDLHHIKKENIGLIEVMGLAILPARLKKEIIVLEEALLEGKDITKINEVNKHALWVQEWKEEYVLNKENIHQVMQKEIGKRFLKVLECAGVYKRTKADDSFTTIKSFL